MYDNMVLNNVIMNYFTGLGHFFAEWVLYVLLVFNHLSTLPSYYLKDINEHYVNYVVSNVRTYIIFTIRIETP